MGIHEAWGYTKDVPNPVNPTWRKAEFYGFWLALLMLAIGIMSWITGFPYVVALLAGLILGRWLFRVSLGLDTIIPVLLGGLGIFIGTIFVDSLSIIVLYGGGIALSYAAHKRKILQSLDV